MTKNVGQELSHQSRKFVDQRLKEYSKIEKAQLEKLKNNVDEKMEAMELQQEVFLNEEMTKVKPEKVVKSKLTRSMTKYQV